MYSFKVILMKHFVRQIIKNQLIKGTVERQTASGFLIYDGTCLSFGK